MSRYVTASPPVLLGARKGLTTEVSAFVRSTRTSPICAGLPPLERATTDSRTTNQADVAASSLNSLGIYVRTHLLNSYATK
jgi:hypothetical protein